MNLEFYKTRPFYTQTFLIPIVLVPILFRLTHNPAISMVFPFLGVALLALSTFWSVKLRILFTLEKSKTNPKFILYEKKLCKIEKATFIYENQKFIIDDYKVYPVVADANRAIEDFKNYAKKKYVSPHLLPHFTKNEFKIEPPSFISLFSEHCVAPFFVFQIFCGVLWCLDEYVYHALFTIVMLVLFEMGVVFQRIKTMSEFMKMNLKPVSVKRLHSEKNNGGIGNLVSSIDLIPGDVIEITTPGIQIPCDLLLLSGNCAVNEAMLSGESLPFTKEDISERNEKEILNYQTDKKNILFGGTELVKCDKIICFVLKTGFDTQQGELIRKMMSNENTVTANNKEAFLFILFLLFFAILASIYSYFQSVKLGKAGSKIMLEIILILTNVVPAELPMELTIAVNASLQSLMKLGIFCLEPFRIPLAGKVDVCCFDKTGTLTETKLTVHSVISEEQDEKKLNAVIASCHSLVKINDKIEGDPIETSVFNFKNIKLIDENTSSLGNMNFKVVKRYLFSSALRRMTVVAETGKKLFVAMKGAPEVIQHHLAKKPANYEKYEEYARDGYRVIALAYKEYTSKTIKREEAESKLSFVGFILYECKLKSDSKDTISALVESGHRPIMITGDNLFTAVNVAQKLGFYNGHGVEGDSIPAILNTEEFNSISVFARADPKHKEQIIEKYKQRNLITLMCGDGTNDVGALKTAHVGIAIVESKRTSKEESIQMGDASVAAPFTAKNGKLNSVLNIVRQGRSALVTTIQMYKILALNSLIIAFSLSVLDSMGVRFSDGQMTASGILIAFSFMFLTTSRPLQKISKKKPLTNIFNSYIITSILGQTLIHIVGFYFLIYWVKLFEEVKFHDKFTPTLMNSALFIISTSQQISTFIINYIGRPFRESIIENKPLLGSLVALVGFIGMLIAQTHDDFVKQMEIVEIGQEMKVVLFCIIFCDFVACFIVEKICFWLFML